MTAIEGVEELVNTPSVFDVRRVGLLADVFTRGVRNFYGNMTLTVFGAAMLAGAAVSSPVPQRTELSFEEPSPVLDGDQQWRTSIDGLRTVIAAMRAGAPPAFSAELKNDATATLTSVAKRSREDVGAWAKALASEDGDLDD
jgi:hypothetical protein